MDGLAAFTNLIYRLFDIYYTINLHKNLKYDKISHCFRHQHGGALTNNLSTLTSINPTVAPMNDPNCVANPHQSRADLPRVRKTDATATFTYVKQPVYNKAEPN